jgi:hypothetical protein
VIKLNIHDPSYRPAHSDFLIHWTGHDIDISHDPSQTQAGMTDDASQAYLDRLELILKYGLWMTHDPAEQVITIGKRTLNRPVPFRTCFTELRLSEVSRHTQRFGRLGIGFKRFFLFNRGGCPMTYFFQGKVPGWATGIKPGSTTLADYMSCFWKPMCSPGAKPNSGIHYDYFDESEWRIIYDDYVREVYERDDDDRINHFVKADTVKDDAFMKAVEASSLKKPGYLIPIRDRWFAMIIYPTIGIKVAAQANQNIRNLIGATKEPFEGGPFGSPSGNYANFEKFNLPLEVDLAALKNF